MEKLYSYAMTAGEDIRAFGTGNSAPPTPPKPRLSERFHTPHFTSDAESEDAAIIDAVLPRTGLSREHSYAFGKPRQPSPVKVPLDLGQISKVAPAASRLQELVRGRRAQMSVSSGSSSELHPRPVQRFVPEPTRMIASVPARLNGSFAESSGTVATEVGSNAAMDATSMPGPPKSFLDSAEAEFPVLVQVVVATEVPGEAAIIVDTQEASALQPDSALFSSC